MNERIVRIAVLTALLSSAQSARAETLHVDRAVALAARHNPLLHAAYLEKRRARQRILAEEDRYPLRVGADAAGTRRSTPSLSPDGVTTSVTDSVGIGTDLAQPFALGTIVGLRLEGSWLQTDELGPGYGIAARLSVEQPLLRGAGLDVGEAELRARSHEGRAAAHDADRVRSALVHDVLIAYWELWYAEEAMRITKSARELAALEKDEAERRVDEGAAAAADVHSFTRRVAELDEALVDANLERRRRSLALSLLFGRADGDLQPTSAPPSPSRHRGSIARAARAHSPELRTLDARIRAARERLHLAGETERPALDFEGWVQAEGLGHGAVRPAFTQFGNMSAVSAHAGLRFEVPVTGSRRAAERAGERLAIEADIARRQALRQQIDHTAHELGARAASARKRAELVTETVNAARAELEAARSRFAAGTAVPLEVHQAADALRRAELRAARARIDVLATSIAVDHLTGALLRRYARHLRKE